MIASSRNMMQAVDLYLKPRSGDGSVPGCMHAVKRALHLTNGRLHTLSGQLDTYKHRHSSFPPNWFSVSRQHFVHAPDAN